MTTNTKAATRGRGLHITLWVGQVLLASQFAMAGIFKLSGDPTMVAMFDDIGAGQWLRYVVGALEVAGALGLLIPRLYGLAALGLAALMVGATVTNVFVLDASPWLALGFLVLAALIAWGRWPDTRALMGAR
ncbi:DoxX family protein [Actinopolymorpha alba]|uniref:DoxX family protein n=1 Tax=Actinopolymorpha alba TaxID=533267 RepID=UPI0003609CA9|nr:DoxX family protein [Actinopolymorpha alba]